MKALLTIETLLSKYIIANFNISFQVSLIYHVAATVKFDEPLDVATSINVKGVAQLLQLAKECQKLESLVHVSTAYSNCPLKAIEERFYEPPIETDELIKLVNTTPKEELEEMTPK